MEERQEKSSHLEEWRTDGEQIVGIQMARQEGLITEMVSRGRKRDASAKTKNSEMSLMHLCSVKMHHPSVRALFFS